MKTMILLDHLAFSEKNYVILNEVNRIVETTLHDVSIVPYDLSNKIIPTSCAIMNLNQLSCFSDGLLMATTIKHASEILSCSNSSKKLLYLWDLDWLFEEYSTEYLMGVMTNKKLSVITRSEPHKEAVKNFFGIETNVVKDFKLEQIWNSLE